MQVQWREPFITLPVLKVDVSDVVIATSSMQTIDLGSTFKGFAES
jgi:hypothetical protein